MRGRSKALIALALVVLVSLPATGARDGSGETVVRTPQGSLRGTTMTSRSGRNINAFRGVRYGLPPTGELRFKPPVAYTERWKGVKNATEDAPACPQANDFLRGPTSEDCLFLNVYSPQIPNQESTINYPVMVIFHPGAWVDLSGQSNWFGPRYLLDEDIVLVTVNFRLGALGFLSTGDSVVPGNNGHKDQVAALEWVRDNIAYFGGDPNSVTIYGYSAGAASVQYHLVSPLSAGLFHRAISGSGSCLSSWAINKDPKTLARRQAKLLNCPHDENTSSKTMIDCLKRKDANDIARSYSLFKEWAFSPGVIFAPVIEAEGSSNRPFLTTDPVSLFQSGNFSQVPWLTGMTDKELLETAIFLLANQSLIDDLNENSERIMPLTLYYERDTPQSRRITQRLKEFYFGNSPITQDSQQALTDIYTDSVFLHGVDRSVKMISRVSRSPVYYYLFTYRGRFGHIPLQPGMDRPPGPVHHDDLFYIFDGFGGFPFFGSDYPEMLTSQRMVKMWANFAKTGNPTPDSQPKKDSLLPTVWSPHTPSNLAYMDIGSDLQMKRALRQDRASLWDELFPLSNSR